MYMPASTNTNASATVAVLQQLKKAFVSCEKTRLALDRVAFALCIKYRKAFVSESVAVLFIMPHLLAY